MLTEAFPPAQNHSGMGQEERISRYKDFKDFKKRILVSTDLFGRGIDIERVNIVVNYDFPEVKEGNAPTVASDQYLHRVGRAGRFGTKGLAISFISSKEDADILAQVQSRRGLRPSCRPDRSSATTLEAEPFFSPPRHARPAPPHLSRGAAAAHLGARLARCRSWQGQRRAVLGATREKGARRRRCAL